ncbi:MAG: hypothetical protein KKB59_15065 [Spirochaetes bacterium]|nr:hypothetical protein [Spirochaetota bacterium]
MRIPLPILLDVPTLTISVFAAYLGSALFVALLYASRRRFPGAHLWITGQALLALGAAGVAIQAFGIPYAALAVSNVALIASVVFFGHAIWIFRFTVRFPSWTYAVIPLSLVAWLLMEGSGVGLRIIVFSGTLSVLSGLVAASLLVPDRSGPSPGFRIASVYFIAVAATGLLRVLSVLLDDAPLSIADEGAMGSLVYLLALLVAFFNLFSYYLFSSAVVERDLRVREQEIRVRNEELLETIGTKDALIAVIGHDLRAPVWSATRYVRSHLVEFEGD